MLYLPQVVSLQPCLTVEIKHCSFPYQNHGPLPISTHHSNQQSYQREKQLWKAEPRFANESRVLEQPNDSFIFSAHFSIHFSLEQFAMVRMYWLACHSTYAGMSYQLLVESFHFQSNCSKHVLFVMISCSGRKSGFHLLY